MYVHFNILEYVSGVEGGCKDGVTWSAIGFVCGSTLVSSALLNIMENNVNNLTVSVNRTLLKTAYHTQFMLMCTLLRLEWPYYEDNFFF